MARPVDLEPLRLGLIGTGQIGEIHAEAIRSGNTGSLLIATADLNPDARIIGIPNHVTDYRRLLDNPDVQGVIIATPPGTHKDFALDAIAAGKHVLVEKPYALTMEDLDNMEKAAQRAGVVLVTAAHATVRPEVRVARGILNPKNIHTVNVAYHQLRDANGASWLEDPRISGGGILWDHGFNALTVVGDLIGNIPFSLSDDTQVDFKPRPSSGKGEASATFNFRFGNQGFGQMHCDWTQPNTRLITVLTLDGIGYTLNLVTGEFGREGRIFYKHPESEPPFRLAHEYPIVFGNFAKQVRSGESVVRRHELDLILQATAAAG